jgi:hypothetical protein
MMSVTVRFMSSLALLAAVLVVAIGGAALSAGYEELVAQAKQGKADIDYAALRIAYADSKFYDGYNSDVVNLREPFQKAFTDGDCESAVKQGQAILEKNYVFIDAHFVLSICYHQLGQTEQSERHTAAARGLLKAILASGDGKTPETAFVVISVAEEYSLIGVQGSKKLQQALINKNGHSYDLLTVVNKSGGKDEIYFNVDRVMRWSVEKLTPRK